MPSARHALRRRREQLDLSQEEVATALGVSTNTYWAWEAGTATPRVGRRRQLAEILQWGRPELDQALDGPSLAGHVVPPWLDHVASVEQGAAEIRAWEPVVVHGLLQTEAYAQVVESIGGADERAVEEKVRVRLRRQAVLGRWPDPLRLWAVLDASVLLRVAGDHAVMADQLRHLVDMAERPNVTIQVMPLSSAAFPVAFGAFALLTAPAAERPYMAMTEDGAGAHYLDRQLDVPHHIDLFDHLTASALSPDETVDEIRRAIKEHYDR